jgi:hypothetical protein
LGCSVHAILAVLGGEVATAEEEAKDSVRRVVANGGVVETILTGGVGGKGGKGRKELQENGVEGGIESESRGGSNFFFSLFFFNKKFN